MNIVNGFLIFVMLVMISVLVQSQTLNEIDARPSNTGARTAALGGAAVGDADNVNSMYWNPATLNFLQSSSVIASSILNQNKQSLENTVTLPSFSLGENQEIGIGIAGSYYGNQLSRPFFGSQGLDVGYSIKLGTTTSIGALVNTRYGLTNDSHAWALSGVIGGFYNPSPGISYGICVDGIGMGINYEGSEDTGILIDRQLPVSVRVGAGFKFPAIYRRAFISISVESQKIFKDRALSNRAGIEAYPVTWFCVRGGILAISTGNSGTLGAGLVFGRLKIDYAIFPDPTLERFRQVTLSYSPG